MFLFRVNSWIVLLLNYHGDPLNHTNQHETSKHEALRFSIFLGWRFSRFRMVDDVVGINFLTGHTILFVGPATEVDQFASFGTERTPRIVLPFSGLSARWTFRHKAKVRRKEPKVKAGREPQIWSAATCRRFSPALLLDER